LCRKTKVSHAQNRKTSPCFGFTMGEETLGGGSAGHIILIQAVSERGGGPKGEKTMKTLYILNNIMEKCEKRHRDPTAKRLK